MGSSQPAFHDSIVYVDESGDHGPVSAEYPIFVLAFCVFEKQVYAEQITTAVQRLKFKYFGHDAVVLHERDIRKAKAPFQFLMNAEVRRQFMADVDGLVENATFTLIAAAIRKDHLNAQYASPANAYHLAMKFGVERIAKTLSLREGSPRAHVICESRGRNEDDELELAFRRACDANYAGKRLPGEIVFAHKHACHAGMELADLIARPIGRHLLKPEQSNRAYEIIERKFRRSPEGKVDGWGLKCFP